MIFYRYICTLLIALTITACGSPQPAQAATNGQVVEFLLSQVRASGVALTGGKVYFYEPGTTTFKTVWLDRGKSTPASNPYTLDSNGTAQIYGDGLYRIVITDSAGATKYDRNNISIRDISGNLYDVADYGSLNDAVAAIGGTPATLQITSDASVTANLVIPSTLELMPLNGAKINHGAYTISYAGSTARWPLVQIFNGTGAVTGLKTVWGEWFGAVGDRVTDDSVALNKASSAIRAEGGRMYFNGDGYRINSTFYLYSNCSYIGNNGAPFTSTTSGGRQNHGTALFWGGGNSGTMVSAENEDTIEFTGIGLYGNYNWSTLPASDLLPVGASNASTVVGINFFTTNGTANGRPNSRNYFSNVSVHYCNVAIFAGNQSTDVTYNTDFWVIEKFTIGECLRGIVVNGVNVCCCEIRSGFLMTYATGIDLVSSGWLKISGVGHAKESPYVPGQIDYMFVVHDGAGLLQVENCQAEGTVTGAGFALFTGTRKKEPTTFTSNAVQRQIDINSKQDTLTFIGNQLASPVYMNAGAAGSNIIDSNNWATAGNGFVMVGSGINYDTNVSFWTSETPVGNGSGTWTPHLFQGATEITSLDTANGTWVKQGKLLFVKCTVSKSSGAPSASGVWAIDGMPYASAVGNTVSILTAGEITINGNFYPSGNYFYIGNNQTRATMAGNQSNTSWTSSSVTLQFSGVYLLP